VNAHPPSAPLAGQLQYVLVAQRLMQDITSGRYPVGSLLPTEFALCTQFGVSRHTVREAIRRLQERGLVTRRRGVGTSVKANRVNTRYVQTSMAISDLPRYVEETRLLIAQSEDLIASVPLAELLRCPSGQRWIRVTGLRYAGREKLPMALSHIYINAAYGEIRKRIGTMKVPIYTLIEQQYGISIVAVEQEIRASIIGAADARRLGVKPASAGLVVTRRYFDDSDRTIEVAVNLHPTDRFSYSMSMRLQAAAPTDA
jgi:GntR family transcriptional regulator